MKILLVLALLVPFAALAEITPLKGKYDPRVRVVDYNPLNVVKITTFYGVSSHVQFSEEETIMEVAVGDDQAWKIVWRVNHLFVKPLAHKADTNVTVLTNLRTYQFALVVQPKTIKDSTAWTNPDLIFSLQFRYPSEETSKREAKLNEEYVKDRLQGAKAAQPKRERHNLDYWVAGSEEISPTAAHDDGRFIYLTFSNNRDMPAVYAVDNDGNEALINTNVIDGNTIVVQRLVRSLILRKGEAVASVVNKSFDLDGGSDNLTGTIASNVIRILKGAKE